MTLSVTSFPGFLSCPAFKLQPNYPNPFNNSTNISFSLNYGQQAKLCIYDITGRKVTGLIDQFFPAGIHLINWQAQGLSSGVYFLQLQSENQSSVIRIELIK